jgi:hypothetical protein
MNNLNYESGLKVVSISSPPIEVRRWGNLY